MLRSSWSERNCPILFFEAEDGIGYGTVTGVQTCALPISQNPAFGYLGGAATEAVNLAFLAGGLYLLHKRLFTWHAPVGMLAGLAVMSLLFWNGSGSDSNGSPLFHLLTGATMLGAFFIVTDPVSGAP